MLLTSNLGKPMPEILDCELYRMLFRIRRFEETVLENFRRGVFHGTTHTYLGQEANAAGVLRHLQPPAAPLQPPDIVFSNHRCHGHFLAYGGDSRALFAEMMGKSSGVCGGRGGSQHLHWRNFYSNGVQGGILPVATGMALAEKLKGSAAVTLVFLGDGTLGQGVAYEAFNMASLWEAPILFVLENNHIAQTTPTGLVFAGNAAARFAAFEIPVTDLDSSDVRQVYQASGAALQQVRAGAGPQALILNTCRFGPHSKGDDTRPADEVARMTAQRDPLAIQAPRLNENLRSEIEQQEIEMIAQAFEQAISDPMPGKMEAVR